MASLTSSFTKTPHDASFSSYLDNRAETYVDKLVGMTQNVVPLVLPTAEADHIISRKKKPSDGEIDVFSADKYFSERIDDDKSLSRTSTPYLGARRAYPLKTKEDMVVINRGGYSRPQTPSVYSEFSSNSQSALIKRRPSNSSRSQTKASNKKNFFSNLGCRCYCSDKESVDVYEDHWKDNYSHNGFSSSTVSNGLGLDQRSINSGTMKTSLEPVDFIRMNKLGLDNYSLRSNSASLGATRDSPCALPISNPASKMILPPHKVQESLQAEDEDKPKKSLEVFGSPMIQNKEGSQSFNLEKRLNMLAWDAIPPAEEIQIQGPKHSCDQTIKDTESDASSDLFELECLSCSLNPVILPRQPASEGIVEDGTVRISTSLYAPSEVSVDWSVVTASMADFSVVSDSEELPRSAIRSEKSSNRMGTKGHKYNISDHKRPMVQNELQKKRSSGGGLLLGCKSQKSVRVAGDVYKTPERVGGEVAESRSVRRSNSYIKTARFQPDPKRSGFASKSRTDLLYIQ